MVLGQPKAAVLMMIARHRRNTARLAIPFLSLVLFVGCVPQSEITSYTVVAEEEPITTDRLLPMFQARVPSPIGTPEFDAPKQWRDAANDGK